MTDAELVNFLEWLRGKWILAEMRTYDTPDHQAKRAGLFVESITNQALVDAYRKHQRAD